MKDINEKDLAKTSGGAERIPQLHKVLRPNISKPGWKLEAEGYIRHEGDCVCPINKYQDFDGAHSGCCKDCTNAVLTTADTMGYYCNLK